MVMYKETNDVQTIRAFESEFKRHLSNVVMACYCYICIHNIICMPFIFYQFLLHVDIDIYWCLWPTKYDNVHVFYLLKLPQLSSIAYCYMFHVCICTQP